MHCTAHFDNSVNNPNNPDPKSMVRWGDQTWEEMMIGFYDIAVALSPSDIENHNLPGLHRRQPEQIAERIMERFDKNHDGIVNQNEIPVKNFQVKMFFMSLDKNHDGLITREEVANFIREKQKQGQSGRGFGRRLRHGQSAEAHKGGQPAREADRQATRTKPQQNKVWTLQAGQRDAYHKGARTIVVPPFLLRYVTIFADFSLTRLGQIRSGSVAMFAQSVAPVACAVDDDVSVSQRAIGAGRQCASEVCLRAISTEALESRLLLSATSATHLVFTVQPTNTTAGTSFSVSVSVEDSSGNVVTTNDSTIRLTVQGHGRFAGDGRTMTATAVDGEANFTDLTLDKAGNYTLEASIGHRHRVMSNSFAISPDTSGSEKLVFIGRDSQYGTVNETLRNVNVAIEDQFGNVIKTDSSTVTLSINSGPTTSFASGVPSPYIESTDNGVAKFNNVTFDTAGTYTLNASDSDSEVSSAISDSITINSHGQHSGDRQHHDGGFDFRDRF